MNELYEMFKKDENTELIVNSEESALRKWFRKMRWSTPVISFGLMMTLIGMSKLASDEGGIGYLIMAGIILMLGFAMRSNNK